MFCCQIYDRFAGCAWPSQQTQEGPGVVSQLRYMGMLSWFGTSAIKPEKGSQSVPPVNIHPEEHVGPDCTIFLFSKSLLRFHGLSINVSMATGRDSMRKPRSDEQRSLVAKMQGIWKKIHNSTKFVWVLGCAHILLLLFYIPFCFQSLLPIFSCAWICPHHFNSFSFSSVLRAWFSSHSAGLHLFMTLHLLQCLLISVGSTWSL